MKEGDTFIREKMAKGVENLRLAYGEAGYVNYTGVPDTKFDDERKIINIDFDVDEGKQFFVSSVNIVGLDQHSRLEILKDLPVGQVYNQRLFALFVEEHFDVLKLHHDDPRLVERHLDERNGTVAITVYACPCPVC
jgi:outer membrane protein insertion porin family